MVVLVVAVQVEDLHQMGPRGTKLKEILVGELDTVMMVLLDWLLQLMVVKVVVVLVPLVLFLVDMEYKFQHHLEILLRL
jgi:hypothetical protein